MQADAKTEALAFELVKVGVAEGDAVKLAALTQRCDSSMAVFGTLVDSGLGPHTARSAMCAAGIVNPQMS